MRSASLPDLVPPEDLVAAIGLSSTQWNLGRIVGPTLAAVVISIGGVAAALWVNAASFFAVIVALGFARLPRRVGAGQRSVLRSVRDGLSFSLSSPPVRAMLPVMAISVFVAAPFIGLVAQMATNVHHGGQGGTSFLVTAQGVGAVAAGASMGALAGRFGGRRVLIGALAVLAPSLVAYGAAPRLWLAAVALVATGGAYMASLSCFTSVTQRAASSELRGRAMVVNNFLLGAAYPLGLVVQGSLADRWSLRSVTVGSGVVLAVLVVVLVTRRSLTDPIAQLDVSAAVPK